MKSVDPYRQATSTAKLYALASVLSLLLGGTQNASAHVFTIQAHKTLNGTVDRVGIDLTPPGVNHADHFTVSYTDENTGKPATKNATTDSLTGTTAVNIQAKPGTITVTNLDEKVPTQTAQVNIFDPPNNAVVTAFHLNPGSNLTFAGNTFALNGGFTAVQTTVDYNPASPTYGIETGYITGINIQGSGGAGTAILHVGDAATQTDLSSAWAQILNSTGPFPAGGVSTPDNLAFSGMLEVNSIMTPFNASFDGTVTFFEDGSTTAQGSLTMSTGFGPVTGTLSASGMPQLVPPPAPEPASFVLLSLGLAGLGFRFRALARRSGH